MWLLSKTLEYLCSWLFSIRLGNVAASLIGIPAFSVKMEGMYAIEVYSIRASKNHLKKEKGKIIE